MVEILIPIKEEKDKTKCPTTERANGCTFTSSGASSNRICVAAEMSKNDDTIGADVASAVAFHHNKFL